MTETVNLPELNVIEVDQSRDYIRVVRSEVPGSVNGKEYKVPAATVFGNGIITETSTVANTVTETVIYTESIPANRIHAGQVIRAQFAGRYSTANASDTFVARLKIAGTTIETLTSVAANTTNGSIKIDFIFTIRTIGSSGTARAAAFAIFDDVIQSNADSSDITINTQAVDDITLTIQWDAAGAGNTVSIDQAWTLFVN